jgi:hypothetical protein
MLDDFREQASTSELYQEEPQIEEPPPRETHFLGMTPAQRMVIALLLMLIVLIIGAFFLLATGKIVPPFL